MTPKQEQYHHQTTNRTRSPFVKQPFLERSTYKAQWNNASAYIYKHNTRWHHQLETHHQLAPTKEAQLDLMLHALFPPLECAINLFPLHRSGKMHVST